jgi:hypothetical protein
MFEMENLGLDKLYKDFLKRLSLYLFLVEVVDKKATTSTKKGFSIFY